MTQAHQPTKESREVVRLWTVAGALQEQIAEFLQIDEKTLRKHYRAELDFSAAKMNAFATGKLYKLIEKGDRAAIFFYLKTRAGWKETMAHELSGPDKGPITSQLDVSKLSDDALREILAARLMAATSTDAPDED